VLCTTTAQAASPHRCGDPRQGIFSSGIDASCATGFRTNGDFVSTRASTSSVFSLLWIALYGTPIAGPYDVLRNNPLSLKRRVSSLCVGDRKRKEWTNGKSNIPARDAKERPAPVGLDSVGDFFFSVEFF
jgi:hypothetical protein